jgi:uncharacterized phiE125 gp8 family phage protein
MAGLTLSSAPAIEPVTATQCKAEARIATTETAHDDWFTLNIAAARQAVERYLQRALITQTWVYTIDYVPDVADYDDWKIATGWPLSLPAPGANDYIALPYPPLQSVTSIVYYDPANEDHTYDSDNYHVTTSGAGGVTKGRVALNIGSTWPSSLRSRDAIMITYVAGYGLTAATVPEAIRVAITRVVTHMFEHRGDEPDAAIAAVAKSMLSPYRIVT